MKLIDTHAHLYLKEFSNDINEVILRAENAGVEKFYLPAIDSSETDSMYQLENMFQGKCMAMAGLHPCSVKENYKEELQRVEKKLQQRKFAGIGETGLDFYWDTSFTTQQYESFYTQIQWALQYNLSLILHTRNAMQETIDVIKKYKNTALRGIFHCFSGTLQNATDIINAGFYLGIGGVITYKNSGIAEVISKVSLEHIVLETDAPYLTPVPFRGKRNESSYIEFILKKLAEIKNVSIEEAAEKTTKNAEIVFS